MMSKAVLLSIKPQYCELIASCKKTAEVRKTRPKIDVPFKCYIYQTKMRWLFNLLRTAGLDNLADRLLMGLGKVIGEFMCDDICEFKVFENGSIQYWNYHELGKTCLTYDELSNYIGRNKDGYGWHISDLVIYDEPKELSEFWHKGGMFNNKYDNIDNLKVIGTEVYKPLTRPPQSWCYVEELEC